MHAGFRHRTRHRWVLHTVTLMLAATLAACSSVGVTRPGKYPATLPPVSAPPAAQTGAIFQPASALTLFEDVKASRVGDTITIRLAERTQASKSAKTDAGRESSLDTGSPVFLGRTPTRDGEPFLNNTWESSMDFSGEGSSSQSNRLDGDITVTVAEVYANGNLYVQGEKWLTLNQGEEYIRITGIVRPADIGPDNSVPSFKVADARIAYSGNGAINDANRPGLLSRFFLKLWPM